MILINFNNIDRIWKRLKADDMAELIDYGLALETDLLPSNSSSLNRPNRILGVAIRDGKLIASELIINFNSTGDVLYTVETGHNFLLPGRLEYALKFYEDPTSVTIALLLLQQLMTEITQVQGLLDSTLDVIAIETRTFQSKTGTSECRGIDQLKEVDDELKKLAMPQSYVIRALFDLDRVARRLRELTEEDSREFRLAESLLAQVEVGIERAKRTISRDRYQWDAASGAIDANNLNLNKIFNALWAIIIPSNVLVNWYGQNFHFMPELSWWGTMPLQLIGCMLITLVPLWIIKQAGAMR